MEKDLVIPNSLKELMKIYQDYEQKEKEEEKDFYTADYLQYSCFNKDPITPFHNEYYYTKYKVSYHWISKLFLVLSIIFSLFYFLGYFLDIIFLNLEVTILGIILLYTVILLISTLSSFFISRTSNKWNWKLLAIIFALLVALEFIIFRTLNLFQEEVKSTFNFFYTVSGLSWAPACIIVFIFARKHKYITDYGGIHLFLGWIYRVSESQGNFKVLTLSFYRLVNELDNWLKESLNVLIKNKSEIYSGFYLNLISNKEFLSDIHKNHQTLFQEIFQGLLIKDILHSDTFSDIEEKDKNINRLDLFKLKWLSLRLAISQLPHITQLLEKLSSKKLEILYYSYFEKLKKYKSKIITLGIFILSTIIPLIFTITT